MLFTWRVQHPSGKIVRRDCMVYAVTRIHLLISRTPHKHNSVHDRAGQSIACHKAIVRPNIALVIPERVAPAVIARPPAASRRACGAQRSHSLHPGLGCKYSQRAAAQSAPLSGPHSRSLAARNAHKGAFCPLLPIHGCSQYHLIRPLSAANHQRDRSGPSSRYAPRPAPRHKEDRPLAA